MAKAIDPGVPVWSHDGLICTGETYKSVVKLTFFKGASLEDPSGLFNSSLDGKTRRAIDFHEGDELDEQAFVDADPRRRSAERVLAALGRRSYTVNTPTSGGWMQRSVAACLASILELDVAEVPVPDERHPEPWTVWRNWLAQRGLGLVPIAEPASFNWPGPWLACCGRPDGDGSRRRGRVRRAPGDRVAPAGRPGDVRRGASRLRRSRPPTWRSGRRPPQPLPRRAGTVEAVVVAPDAEAAMVRVEGAVARAGRGLEGDRYFDQRGTFSNAHGRGHDLTLIEAEVLDEPELPAGRLAARRGPQERHHPRGRPQRARRQAVQRSASVECFGQRLCEPCAHLERLTAQAGKPGTLRALIHKGGLRADVLTDGEIRAGDEIAAR